MRRKKERRRGRGRRVWGWGGGGSLRLLAKALMGGGWWDIEGLSEERQTGEGMRRKGFGIGFCTRIILSGKGPHKNPT